MKSLTKKFLTYALFAVICSLVSILLYVKLDTSPQYILASEYAHWLEYPLMSLAIITAGATLLYYIEKNENKK